VVSSENSKNTFKRYLIRKVIQDVLDYRISQPIHSFIKDMANHSKIQFIYGAYNSAFRNNKSLAIFVEADMLKRFNGRFANNDLEYKFVFLINNEWVADIPPTLSFSVSKSP
jgi:hypothetical protein